MCYVYFCTARLSFSLTIIYHGMIHKRISSTDYFHSFKTPSCDALTINCWFLYGTMSRSVMKSTWECMWADSGCWESGEAAPLPGDTEEDQTSLKTSTPSMILDLHEHKTSTIWAPSILTHKESICKVIISGCMTARMRMKILKESSWFTNMPNTNTDGKRKNKPGRILMEFVNKQHVADEPWYWLKRVLCSGWLYITSRPIFFKGDVVCWLFMFACSC